jgi:hypothetical protein
VHERFLGHDEIERHDQDAGRRVDADSGAVGDPGGVPPGGFRGGFPVREQVPAELRGRRVVEDGGAAVGECGRDGLGDHLCDDQHRLGAADQAVVERHAVRDLRGRRRRVGRRVDEDRYAAGGRGRIGGGARRCHDDVDLSVGHEVGSGWRGLLGEDLDDAVRGAGRDRRCRQQADALGAARLRGRAPDHDRVACHQGEQRRDAGMGERGMGG